MIQKLFAFLLYRVLGWKIEGRIPFETKRLLLVLLPHTSNWDFVIGMMFLKAEKLDVILYGKDEFYIWPLIYGYKLFNVVPIKRNQKNNFVEEAAKSYDNGAELWTAMAPEGTRSHMDHLKSGYYYFAKAAKVPLLTVGLDFKKKALIIEPQREILDSFEEDSARLIQFSRSIQGKRAHLGI